jgi:hypothetical protein
MGLVGPHGEPVRRKWPLCSKRLTMVVQIIAPCLGAGSRKALDALALDGIRLEHHKLCSGGSSLTNSYERVEWA